MLHPNQLALAELQQLKYVDLHTLYEKQRTKDVYSEELQELLKSLQQKNTHSSNLHLNIAKYLEQIEVNFINEHAINDLVVDIAIPERKLAIEVDGPTHFAFKSREPLGHTVFKRRLLHSMGWTVVSIPYWDWNNLDTDEDKRNYLKKVISPSFY